MDRGQMAGAYNRISVGAPASKVPFLRTELDRKPQRSWDRTDFGTVYDVFGAPRDVLRSRRADELQTACLGYRGWLRSFRSMAQETRALIAASVARGFARAKTARKPVLV